MFTVPTSHAYAEEGQHTLRVVISDAGGAVTSLAPVAIIRDAALNATALALVATEGTTFSGAVATFSDADPAGTASEYSATIDWGDKSALTTVSGSAITASNGMFTVSAKHAYAEEGTYTLGIVITDPGGATTTIFPLAAVGDAAVNAVAAAITATEGATFNGTVATFTDADPAANAADYGVTIDWADNSPPTTISGSQITTAGGVFTVPASHAYAEEGAYTLSVVVSDVGGAKTTVAPVVTVSDATLSAAAARITATEGAAFNGAVATFTDADTAGTATDYTATIDWGDKGLPTTIAGSQMSSSGGVLTISASHTYAGEGTYTLNVVVRDAGGAATTIAPTATVVDGALSATAAAVAATEGATFSGAVATFTDADPAGVAADYTATVDWGDNSSPSTIAASQIASAAGIFTLIASHIYAEEGQYSLRVTISDAGGAATSVAPVATVGDAALNATPLAVVATEGATFRGAVAAFTDADSASAAADYTATIDWGDKTSATTIAGSQLSSTAGIFTIPASHSYAEEGTYTLDVAVRDGGGATTTVRPVATVADAALSAAGFNVAATEGTAFTGSVAIFADGDPAASAADYTATIDWGDKSAPTIVSGSQITTAGGVFTVPASHAYAEEGTYTLSVVIDDAGGAATTVAPVATVSDAAMSGANGASATGGVEGVTSAALSGATFIDDDTSAPLTDFSVTAIDWGDGSTSAAGLTFSGSGGNYTIGGSHLYADEGVHNFKITIKDAGGATATITGSANVADAALKGNSAATASGGIEVVSPATLAGATFTDANAGATLNDFAITAVDWGDGGTSAAGLSISGGGGNFTIGGSHVYTEYGIHNFKIIAKDAGGSTATISGSANVGDAALSATAGNVSSTEGTTFSGAVASFTDGDPAGAADDYTAAIDWGDKSPLTTITGSQITAEGGVFTVPASHAFAEEGTYNLSVVISDAGGAKATVAPVATISDVPLNGAGVSIASGTSVSSTVVSFSDPDIADSAANYTASIDWGDGQTSTGAIAAGTAAGQFTVTGDHNYADNSKHTISVTVLHGSDQPLVVTSVEPGLTMNALGNFALVEDDYVIGSGTVNVSTSDGVLANDSAPSALTVTTGAVTGANGGTFTFHTDGSFTYAPPSTFPGFDYAKYAASDAQGDQASARVNVLSQPGGVVWKFYESVLNRDPEYGGLQYWINDFVHGGKTGDIAVGFFESDELLDKIIGGYYQQYLGRALDQDGLNYWKGAWRATGGPEIIKAGFAASTEFNNNAGNTVDGWLTALYQRILNRSPDPQGFAYWKQRLAAGMIEKDVALGFFDSKEAFSNDVRGRFEEYLLRAPNDGELNQYVQQMLSGASDKTIEQEITNLPEYGENPPPPPDGEAVRLPDYYQPSGGPERQAIVARDAVFSSFGG